MDECLKNNQYRTLELFLEMPNKEFSIRGMARELKISHATVIKHIRELFMLSLVKKNNETLYPTYRANTENTGYRMYKKNRTVYQLHSSGIIDNIQKKALPSSIILFGSSAKGTDTEKSDIDIFVESKAIPIDLTKSEKKLKKKINLLFEPEINSLSDALKNNIANGIILYGFLKLD